MRCIPEAGVPAPASWLTIMPIRSTQGLTALPLYDLTLTVTSETGFLTAVSAYDPYGTRGSAELWGQLSLGSTDSPQNLPLLLLNSGYFGSQQLLGWTGRLQLHPTTIIIGRFRSLIATAITLVIHTEA